MSDLRLQRRLVRRALHRSRSVAVSVSLAIIAVGAAYLGLEAGVAAAGLAPLLVSPDEILAALADPDAAVRPALIVGAGVAAVAGIVMLVLAVAPGRRARHELGQHRRPIVVDDDVLARAVSQQAATTASVSRGQVSTRIGARRARVSVRPTSGFPVDPSAVSVDAESLVADLAPRPRVRVTVAVAEQGVLAG